MLRVWPLCDSSLDRRPVSWCFYALVQPVVVGAMTSHGLVFFGVDPRGSPCRIGFPVAFTPRGSFFVQHWTAAATLGDLCASTSCREGVATYIDFDVSVRDHLRDRLEQLLEELADREMAG